MKTSTFRGVSTPSERKSARRQKALDKRSEKARRLMVESRADEQRDYLKRIGALS